MEIREQWNSIILVLRRKVETVSSGGKKTKALFLGEGAKQSVARKFHHKKH